MGQLDRMSKQAVIKRLAICLVIALALYYGGEKLWEAGTLPIWEKCRPWLNQNKIQAIALVTAALFGISLTVWPLESAPDSVGCPPPDATDAPEGFTLCG